MGLFDCSVIPNIRLFGITLFLKIVVVAKMPLFGIAITQDRVLGELAATEDGKRIPLLDENNNPLMIKDVELILTDNLTENQLKAIAGIKRGKFGIEVSQCDKVRALELIGRHLGIFKDRVEVSGLEDEKTKLDDILSQMRSGG